jgi:hypothetical protein
VTPSAFTAQMDYLAKNGYRVRRWRNSALRRSRAAAEGASITIDDATAPYDIAFDPGMFPHVFLYSDSPGGDALRSVMRS